MSGAGGKHTLKTYHCRTRTGEQQVENDWNNCQGKSFIMLTTMMMMAVVMMMTMMM